MDAVAAGKWNASEIAAEESAVEVLADTAACRLPGAIAVAVVAVTDAAVVTSSLLVEAAAKLCVAVEAVGCLLEPALFHIHYQAVLL